MKKIFLFLFIVTLPIHSMANVDSLKLDMPKIFGFALDGNLPEALKLLNVSPKELVIKKHAALRDELIRRFAGETDQSTFLSKRHSEIDSLLILYKTYWRKSFLNHTKNYDSVLQIQLVGFLNRHSSIKINPSNNEEALGKSLKDYINSKGYHTTGFSRTGKYLDLLVWKTEKDTVYQFSVNGEAIKTPVTFMQNFITLGWEEYATADRLYPGGWATDQGLFCVKNAYDLKSESFNISYLMHEGRHFNDYKLFPGLSGANLEYRAKLTELTTVDKTVWDILRTFIINSNQNTTDDHQLASYYVMRDLSKSIFKTDIEKDLDKWKKVPIERIHKASIELLVANSKYLKTNKSYVN